ncbi:MAG: GntR family transcriptional regulator [Chloroflexi bacterium]|nr:GntR family transcriptional regulator [Chloroflexota bacterium]
MAILSPALFTALRDEVFEGLVEEIVSGRLPAGQRLLEAEIARQLGVSKTPVREAMIRLGRMGLVVYHPRRGTFVAEIGPEIVRDIFALRRLIEGYVTAEAARRATPDHLRSLERIVDDLAAAERRGDWHALSDCDILFHERLYALCGSRLFLEIWQLFRDQVRLWHRVSKILQRHSAPRTIEWTVERLHRDILEAVREGSPVCAENAARVHIERAQLLVEGGPLPDGSAAR